MREPHDEDVTNGLRRIWDEYVEMPGLRLTCDQAKRLWHLDAQTCTSFLEGLVALGFLVRGLDGRYGRTFQRDEVASRLRMATVDVSRRHSANALRRAVGPTECL